MCKPTNDDEFLYLDECMTRIGRSVELQRAGKRIRETEAGGFLWKARDIVLDSITGCRRNLHPTEALVYANEEKHCLHTNLYALNLELLSSFYQGRIRLIQTNQLRCLRPRSRPRPSAATVLSRPPIRSAKSLYRHPLNKTLIIISSIISNIFIIIASQGRRRHRPSRDNLTPSTHLILISIPLLLWPERLTALKGLSV